MQFELEGQFTSIFDKGMDMMTCELACQLHKDRCMGRCNLLFATTLVDVKHPCKCRFERSATFLAREKCFRMCSRSVAKCELECVADNCPASARSLFSFSDVLVGMCVPMCEKKGSKKPDPKTCGIFKDIK